MKIGYVGLGAMGGALAAHLVNAQDLLVWDINPKTLRDFDKTGTLAAAALSDIGARCDIVLLCLPTSANVNDALFGKGGLAETLRPGALVIDQTSGDPNKTKAFAATLAARGVTLIDAPVAGGVPSAIAGQVAIMASGPAAAYEKARPVFRTITPNVFHCSTQVGDGQSVKAINNMVNAANRVASLEIVGIGRRMGLATAAMAEAVNAGPAKSFITNRLLPALVDGGSSATFALALMVKDVNQAAAIGVAAGVPTPMSDAARGVMNIALNILADGAVLDDMVPFMERLMKASFVGAAAEVPAGIDHNRALDLIVNGMVACNRAVVIENTAVAVKAGLNAADFSPVINAGSGASAEAKLVFDYILGKGAGETRVIGDMIDVLTRLSELGAANRVPMMMVNAARSQYLACAKDLGRDATLDDMTGFFVEAKRQV